MKHSARLETSIDLLARISMGKIPMDNVIRDFMAARRFIGSKDRTAIVERVYRATRGHARLGWWVEKGGLVDTSRTRILADFILSDAPDHESIDEIFCGGKYAPEPLSDEERTFINFLNGKALTDDAMPVDVRCECPEWAAPKLHALFDS